MRAGGTDLSEVVAAHDVAFCHAGNASDTSLGYECGITRLSSRRLGHYVASVYAEFHRHLEAVSLNATDIANWRVSVEINASEILAPSDDWAHLRLQKASSCYASEIDGELTDLFRADCFRHYLPEVTAVQHRGLVDTCYAADINVLFRVSGTVADVSVVLAVLYYALVHVGYESGIKFGISA